jgi:hypothetical protein
LICWDVYLSHRDSALLARLKAKYVFFLSLTCVLLPIIIRLVTKPNMI